MADPDLSATTTVEQDGRTLSGVGVTEDRLAETMDRHAPEPTTPPAPASTPTESAATTPAVKPTRGQARFSELTQKAKDAEAKAEAAERKAAELEAKLAQQPAPRQEPTPTEPRQPAPAPQYTRPKPTEDEIGTKYPTYADFTEDVSRWVWEQQQPDIQAAIRAGIESDRAQQAFTTLVESTRARGRAAYKDFDQMLASGPGTFINMPMPAIQAIVKHPQSEHLQYAIMRDGTLAQKLAAVAATTPYEFAFELAKIAPAPPAATSASTGASGSATPPPPVQPVGSGSRTTTLSSAEHAKAGDYQAYKAARAAERSVGRRR